ncbi:MAG TPA: methyltransferase domain-containing protein, partial [Chitinophagaceae bacterium]
MPAAFPRSTLFNNKTFHYVRCTACDLVFINPLPSAADYEKMYGLDYHEEFYFKQSPNYENFHRLLEARQTNRRLLDFGCGDGSFLNYFIQRGYSCAGTEFNPGLVMKVRGMYKGMRFERVEDLDELLATFRPGIVYMGDVLEHLTEPLHFLQSLYSKLDPGAHLLVQGPVENNTNMSLSVRKLISKLKSGQPAHHVPYHITFSNATNQRAVFERSGFQTLYFRLNETAWPMPSD